MRDEIYIFFRPQIVPDRSSSTFPIRRYESFNESDTTASIHSNLKCL